jgi:hypothetical protein
MNMADEWIKQENSAFWSPEKNGDELVGEVIAIDEGQYGKNYTVKKEDGTVVITGANKALLPRMMNVKVGGHVKIVYLGEELPKIKGYKPTKLFDVFIKKN